MRMLWFACLLALLGTSGAARAADPWMVLPPTPTLPPAKASGYAPVNGIKIWYAEFGQGAPIILLHGGLANSNYWGNQVPVLAEHYRVIVMDTDVIALMDFLKIDKAAVVGWSDGAILGLDIAINHPERLTKLFAFAANSDPSGVADISKSTVFNDYIARAEKEYEQLSATPTQYKAFLDQIGKMWET